MRLLSAERPCARDACADLVLRRYRHRVAAVAELYKHICRYAETLLCAERRRKYTHNRSVKPFRDGYNVAGVGAGVVVGIGVG